MVVRFVETNFQLEEQLELRASTASELFDYVACICVSFRSIMLLLPFEKGIRISMLFFHLASALSQLQLKKT